MAITRAQQVKQLLANGGRIGLKGGADAATVGFDKSYDKANPRGPSAPRSVNVSPTGSVTTSRDDPRPAQEYIGGQSYDVTPENRKQREDLAKAKWYLNDLIIELEKKIK